MRANWEKILPSISLIICNILAWSPPSTSTVEAQIAETSQHGRYGGNVRFYIVTKSTRPGPGTGSGLASTSGCIGIGKKDVNSCHDRATTTAAQLAPMWRAPTWRRRRPGAGSKALASAHPPCPISAPGASAAGHLRLIWHGGSTSEAGPNQPTDGAAVHCVWKTTLRAICSTWQLAPTGKKLQGHVPAICASTAWGRWPGLRPAMTEKQRTRRQALLQLPPYPDRHGNTPGHPGEGTGRTIRSFSGRVFSRYAGGQTRLSRISNAY
jgi:hypothetical protein